MPDKKKFADFREQFTDYSGVQIRFDISFRYRNIVIFLTVYGYFMNNFCHFLTEHIATVKLPELETLEIPLVCFTVFEILMIQFSFS